MAMTGNGHIELLKVTKYCKTLYYRAPFNFTHFARGDDDAYITGADIRSHGITKPNLAAIQLMRVIIWPRSDSDGSYVKINVRGNKGFYSTTFNPQEYAKTPILSCKLVYQFIYFLT